MIRWFKSLFAWRVVKETFVHLYYENSVTGRRRIVPVHQGYEPIDWQWLETGEWETFDIKKVPSMASSVTPASKV